MKKKSGIHYAWFILFALSIIVGLAKSAINNSAGLFLGPVSQDLGVGIGKLTLYLSIASIITIIILSISGKLLEKFSPKLLIIVSIILQSGAFFGFGFMSVVWGWYILSAPLSIGGTLLTVVLGPVLINQWFSKKNGMALGILNAGSGAMGAIAQPIISKLIANQGWSFTYKAVGLTVMSISLVVALLLIKNSPASVGLEPLGADEEDLENKDTVSEEIIVEGIDFEIAKKSKAFYSLFAFFFFIVSISSFSMHLPNYLTASGFDVEFAGSVMGYYMLGVLAASLLIGVMIDKIGVKLTAIITLVFGMIGFLILLKTTNSTMIILAVLLLSFVSSGVGTTGPALSSGLFGPKSYGQIYSSASLGLALSSIVALPAYGFLFDLSNSYDLSIYAILVMFVILIAAIFIGFKDKERLVKEGHWN